MVIYEERSNKLYTECTFGNTKLHSMLAFNAQKLQALLYVVIFLF